MTRLHYITCYANAKRERFDGLARAIAVLYFNIWGEAMPGVKPDALGQKECAT